MNAWQIQTHGGLDQLKLVELPDPIPGPGQVRVRVQSVGLNHLDLWVRKGVPGHKFPLPLIPGCDISGSVDSYGPLNHDQEKTVLPVGAPVIVSPGISCGVCEHCLGGFDPLCRGYELLGETIDGGCADYVVVPIANLILRPASLSASQAAALQIAFLTAWTMVQRKARVQPGELVLIQAGGSGVSVAAIQICKMIGAQVITTVGSDDKKAHALSLGADHVINYKTHGFRDEVKKIAASYGKKGCEVVIDHVGTDTLPESLKCLTWGGRLTLCGATTGSDLQLDLKQVFFKNLSILGTTMGSKADLIEIVKLAGLGKLKPVIDSEFMMTDLPKAHAKLESRTVFGKVIVKQAGF
jgi:NADPH:quinone reductase-like Zn-dependent oxidoreductase